MVHRPSPEHVSTPDSPLRTVGPRTVGPRPRRNLWLGLAIGGLALLFYATIIIKTGWLGVPPGFR